LRCAAIRDTSTPGRVACTQIPGFCWTPAELREEDADGLGCREHEEG